MNNEIEQNYIIELLRCAITNTTPSLPKDDLDWDVVFNYAKIHRILPVLFFSIQKLPEVFKSRIVNLEAYELSYKANLIDDANRENEISIVTQKLTNNHIDYILLKGSVTKHFYPDTSMRMMSDIDILYRNKSDKEVKVLFEELGYTQTKSTPKDAMYLSSNKLVKIEMQESLIDDGFTDWLQYLDTIWDRCIKKSEYEYVMTPEDFYIYHIVHMAKHFINGGIGLRHILDTIVIRNHYIELDYEYISSILDKLSLQKFERQIINLIDLWFKDSVSKDLDAISLLSEYIFSNGAFGNTAQQSINEASLNNSNVIRNKLFPSREMMTNYYGDKIRRFPILIPLYWIKLNLERLFKRTDKAKIKLKTMSNISNEQVEKTKKIFESCGLK